MKSRSILAQAVSAALGMAILPQANAVNIAENGIGQILYQPYYTVQNGFNSEFNIQNTSDQTVVVKIRFREGENSRDVLDFNVVLSPYDYFAGYITQARDDRPVVGDGLIKPLFVIPEQDTTCTVPNLPRDNPATPAVEGTFFPGRVAYTDTTVFGDNSDGGSTGTDRMFEGYVEFMMMGSGDPDTSALAAKAVHGGVPPNRVPADCATIVTAFGTNTPDLTSADGNLATLRGEDGFPDYDINPLKGNWAIINVAAGVGTAGGALPALANACDDTLVSATDSTVTGCSGFMTLQLPPSDTASVPPGPYDLDLMDSYKEPTIVQVNTEGSFVDVNGVQNVLTGSDGADAVSYALQRQQDWNIWTNRPATTGMFQTQTDVYVTFPTKLFYVDNYPTSVMSARTTEFGGRLNLPSLIGPFEEVFDDGSCVPYDPSVYDREEYKLGCTENCGDDPVISPSPLPEGDIPEVCNEVNIFTFGSGAGLLGSRLQENITELPGIFGHFALGFAFTGENSSAGLPMLSGAFIKRALAADNDIVHYPSAFTRTDEAGELVGTVEQAVVPDL